MRIFWVILVGIGLSVVPGQVGASNLANPGTPIPEARVAVGVSYHLAGVTISNDSIPSLMNRFHVRASYAPLSVVNFGLDLGATQIEVAGDTNEIRAYPGFHGKYGFSGGGHLKVSTPFFFDGFLAVVGIASATYFSSKNDYSALYGGFDGNGGLGLQVHVPGFGYITAGSSLYLIQGSAQSASGATSSYSNVNNLRGWLAVDFFPPMKAGATTNPFLSLEISVSPKAGINGRAPLEEISFSISAGSITKRLYGQESDIEWRP